MPEPGWTTAAEVTEVYDGDTVTVRVTKEFRVRLLGCWAAEVRTTDDDEKQRGIAARDHLRGLIDGKAVLLEIPTQHNGDVGKSISMSRVLGRLYLDGENVSELMVESGHATRDKERAKSK